MGSLAGPEKCGLKESNPRAGGDLLDPGRYYGTATGRRAAGEITLAESRYAGHVRLPTHAHRAPYLCLVVDGWFEEQSGGRRETCGTGTVVFHPAHEEHADRFGADGARCFNLELAPALADRLADEGGLPRGRRSVGPGRASVMAAALRALPGATPLETEDAVLALLADLGSGYDLAAAPRRPAWIGRSIARLSAPEPPSIAALADEAGVHPVYFARAFRAAVHAAPSAVAARARLERAGAALLESDASVSVVAHASGFADHSHFCRHFRHAFGVTPTAYRRLFTPREPTTGARPSQTDAARPGSPATTGPGCHRSPGCDPRPPHCTA
jgi:AraC family transcriptional regulator